jgi:hypothetical protein
LLASSPGAAVSPHDLSLKETNAIAIGLDVAERKPVLKGSDLPEWQTAIEALMLCSRGGDPMLARIGVMKALNRHVERVFNPERKETHWGKRKLKRDQ